MDKTKSQILFVDDEPALLQALKRLLRQFRSEWEMTFVESGKEALEHLSKHPCDVIVTDMRMPGMDGTELLERVAASYPETVRIVLSGQANKETVLRSVRPTHQYLSKPCNADELKSIILRACRLRELLQDPTLKRLITKVDNLPSLPAIYSQVSEALTDPETSVREIADLISQDVAMTAKVLKMVNSAYFGMPQIVRSAQQAVSILGLETVKALTLAVGVFSQFENLATCGFALHEFEEHSHKVATMARKIAANETDDPQIIANAYLGGFMHDIGKLVLIDNLRDEYSEVLEIASADEALLTSLEEQQFGANHATIGAYLLGIWGLHDDIVEAIAFHHAPALSAGTEFSPLTAVHVANAVDHTNMFIGVETDFDLQYLESLSLENQIGIWTDLALQTTGELTA